MSDAPKKAPLKAAKKAAKSKAGLNAKAGSLAAKAKQDGPQMADRPVLFRRERQRRHLNITMMIPTMITVAATCSALTGVRYAIEGRMEFAVAAIFFAALLDGLDGRMARLLNAASEFGAQIDSLSDFVSFGVCPALILYFWSLSGVGGPGGGFGWMATLFLAICCGLRLARFNSRLHSLPAYAYNFFQGVPAPMGAALALMPLIAQFVIEAELDKAGFDIPALAVAIWAIAVGLLMVSELPTYSFKKLPIRRNLILPIMALVGLVLAGIASAPWLTLLLLLSFYLLLMLFSYRSFKKLQFAADALQQDQVQAKR